MTTVRRGRRKKDTYDRVERDFSRLACNRARPAARDFTSRSSLNVMHRRFSGAHLGPGPLVVVPEQSPTSYNIHTFLPYLLVGPINRHRLTASLQASRVKGNFLKKYRRGTKAEFFAGFRARRIIFLGNPVRNCSLFSWVTLTDSAR